MATNNITVIQLSGTVVDNVLSLSANGSFYMTTQGFPGFSFDLNMVSSAAAGTLSIYAQDTLPGADSLVRIPISKYTIASGNFGTISGTTTVQSIRIDNNSVTNASYVYVTWVGTDTSSGSLTVVGYKQIF